MAQYSRKTFDDRSFDDYLGNAQPSAALRFMRRRRAGPWGGGTASTLLNVATLGAWGVSWSLGWGALSLPFEVGHHGVKAAKFLEKIGKSRLEFSAPVVDTRAAFTMRQASLQAMHDSAFSLRAAIGNEARLLHS